MIHLSVNFYPESKYFSITYKDGFGKLIKIGEGYAENPEILYEQVRQEDLAKIISSTLIGDGK